MGPSGWSCRCTPRASVVAPEHFPPRTQCGTFQSTAPFQPAKRVRLVDAQMSCGCQGKKNGLCWRVLIAGWCWRVVYDYVSLVFSPRPDLEAKEQPMPKRLTLSTVILAALVAGCSDTTNPTAPLPNTPSFDGGWTIGSGGRSDTTTTPPSTQSTAGGVNCGGWTIGSGGVAQGAGQCAGQ